MIKYVAFFLCFSALMTWGCTRHEVEMKPVEVKPIHITVDVNVRVERAVEDFYGDIYGIPSKTEQSTENGKPSDSEEPSGSQ